MVGERVEGIVEEGKGEKWVREREYTGRDML